MLLGKNIGYKVIKDRLTKILKLQGGDKFLSLNTPLTVMSTTVSTTATEYNHLLYLLITFLFLVYFDESFLLAMTRLLES